MSTPVLISHLDYKIKFTAALCLDLQRFSIFIRKDVVNYLITSPSKTVSLFSSPSLQSTSGSAQVGLLPQGVRLLRSSAVPQASPDAFAFPQTACSLEQNFNVEDINTPKVGPVLVKGRGREDSGKWVSLFMCLSLALI